MAPANTEERIVWYSIVGTYGFYVLGALYVLAPVIAWVLFAIAVVRIGRFVILGDQRYHVPLPGLVIVWFLGMLVMLLALVVGHFNYDMGLGAVIKSTIGWAKGWALLAIFPLIGCLNIRPEIIYRAACIVSLHTIILAPVFILAWMANLPQVLYVSPLQKVGGPGPEFFAMSLYEIDPSNGSPRWRLFTPWAPALGFVANIYFVFALQEKKLFYKVAGIIGCIIMVLLSGSRLGLLSLISVSLITWWLSMMGRPFILWVSGVGAAFTGLAMAPILSFAEDFATKFREARADSSRVREALARIAVNRWREEAPIWGHGQVEAGPHLVEYMMIGSHHTWYGLLYVKGAVGLVAMAVPLACSFVYCLIKAMHTKEGRVALSVVLLLFLYTFGENLEVLAYLIWPGLLFIGIASKHTLQEPNPALASASHSASDSAPDSTPDR